MFSFWFIVVASLSIRENNYREKTPFLFLAEEKVKQTKCGRIRTIFPRVKICLRVYCFVIIMWIYIYVDMYIYSYNLSECSERLFFLFSNRYSYVYSLLFVIVPFC